MRLAKGQEVIVNEGHIRSGQTGTVLKAEFVLGARSGGYEYFVRFKDNVTVIYGEDGITKA